MSNIRGMESLEIRFVSGGNNFTNITNSNKLGDDVKSEDYGGVYMFAGVGVGVVVVGICACILLCYCVNSHKSGSEASS